MSDYPTIRPRLLLDFANSKKLDRRITFRRASTGTYVGVDGLIKTAGIDEPRFDHDGTTGVCKGLLIEESRTNYITNSDNLAAWTTKAATVTQDGTTILGASAWKVTASTTLDNHYVTNNYGNYRPRGFVYLKRGNTRYAAISSLGPGSSTQTGFYPVRYVILDFNTGSSFSSAMSYSITTIVPNDTYKIEYWFDYTGGDITSGGLSIHPLQQSSTTTYFTGNGEFVYAAMPQNEGQTAFSAGFTTSYIPTTASAVTRSADLASITGTNFSSWYNASNEFTFLSECQLNGGGGEGAAAWSMATASSARVWAEDGNRILYRPGEGVYQSNLSEILYARRRTIFAFSQSSRTLVGNRNGVFSSITSFPSTVSFYTPILLRIMNTQGTTNANGAISRLVYWPKRLPDAQLQALTRR